MCDVKKKKKRYNALRKTNFFFFNDKIYIIFFITKAQTLRWTVTSLATFYIKLLIKIE